MKIKIKENACQIFRDKWLSELKGKYSWKYHHILLKLAGKEITVKEEGGKLISPAIYGVSILPFEIHPDVWEKI